MSGRLSALSAQGLEAGFTIVPSVLSADDCDSVLAAVERGGARRSRGFSDLMAVPEVRRLASDPRLMGIAAAWVGGTPFPYRATLFDKSDEANGLVVWHQDTALPLRERFNAAPWGPWSVKDGVLYAHAPAEALTRIVALRVHLDDSLAENGPLRVIPGSHSGGC